MQPKNVKTRLITMRSHLFLLLTILAGLFVLSPISVQAQSSAPAFPGAVGFGADTVGGRGGRVIEVTNLNDSGPGSLRAAIEESGPRTVVFRVGGTIDLTDSIDVRNPNITIAGQTAPGGGIALRGGGITIRTSQVIIRFLRIRPGADVPDPGNTHGISLVNSAQNVIVDHSSISWGTDENVGIASPDVRNVTLQWNIITEGLNCATHPEGCHSRGIIVNRNPQSITIYGNLISHNAHRHPEMQGGQLQLVNNVMYGYNNGTLFIPKTESDRIQADVIGNYYIPNDPEAGRDVFVSTSVSRSLISLYVQGNISPRRDADTDPENSILRDQDFDVLISTRNFSNGIPVLSAHQAYEDVLNNAGATLPSRDSADARVVSQVRNRSGSIIDSPSQVGGWPALANGTPLTDSDHDGMPDSYETQNGFNPNNAADGAQDSNGDGYTNLEDYLNSLAAGVIYIPDNPDPDPTTPAPDPTTPSPDPTTPAPTQEPVVPIQLQQPKGTIQSSTGNPVYEWNVAPGASRYELYLAPQNNLIAMRFYNTIQASQFCDATTCSVDLTTLAAMAWLNNDTYVLYIKPNNAAWTIAGTFTINAPLPAVITPAATTGTSSLRPTLNWTLEGTGTNTAFYQVYVAPTNNVTVPVVFQWVARNEACGGWGGTTCSFQMPVQLSNNTDYTVYIQSWGPGGMSVGGPLGIGWQEMTFSVSQ